MNLDLLYLNHNVRGTGTYQRAFHFARALAARGHRVTLVTTSRSARLRAAWSKSRGVRILEAPDLWWGPARTGWDPWNTLRRIRLLRGERYDLVHAFDSRPAVILPALAVRRRTGAALFLDWADWWGRGGRIAERSGPAYRATFGHLEAWFEEAFRGHALASTVISAALHERAAGLGLDPRTILRVPNGCDPDGIRPAVRAEARERLGFPAGAPLVAHLGTLTPGEMSLLTDAFRVVRRRLPGARIVFVGEPGAAVPADLLTDGAAVRAGFVAHGTMVDWLAAADVCVIPMPDTVGNRGRWPGKINDYFAAGRATVITAVGDAAELVRRRGLGWVAAPAAAALAAGLLRALESPAESAEAGARARRLAEDELDWDRLAGRLEAFYLGHLHGTGAPAPPRRGRGTGVADGPVGDRGGG